MSRRPDCRHDANDRRLGHTGLAVGLSAGLALARGSWAGALWLGQRLARPASPRVADALGRLSWAARRRLDPVSQLMVLLGDDLDRAGRDYLPDDFTAESWRRSAAKLRRDALASLNVLEIGRRGRASRLELAHKAEVYLLVRRASASLGPDAHRRERFLSVAREALHFDSRQVMWALEGLAHGHVQAVLDRDPNLEEAPRGLLRGLDLPETALLMAHLGLGMAIAERVLLDLYPDDDVGAVAAVARFQRLCRANANPPQLEAALESFGLVARCFYPELVPTLDRALTAPAGRGLPAHYFWHGVGRALYFLPLHLLPGYGHVATALSRADREAPGPEARHNARSGAAYACTLVNLGSPEVIAELLTSYPEQVDNAFVEGVLSALLLRRNTTPDDRELGVFLAYRPADPELRQCWQERLAGPIGRAFDRDSAGTDGTYVAEGAGVVAQKVVQLTGAHP